MKKQSIWLVASTGARLPPVPRDLPLCATLRSGWSSCRERQYKANLPQFWATEKGGVWSKHLPKVTLLDAKNVCR